MLRRLRELGEIIDARFDVQRACDCYRAWNPAAGSSGFGHRSVQALVEAAARSPIALRHS